MFAPQLYSVIKLDYNDIINKNFNLTLSNNELKQKHINQQDNQLFRQIRLVTKTNTKFNSYIIFVDIRHGKSDKEKLSELIINGFTLNNRKYVISERSASMVRNAILSFVDEAIIDELNDIIGLGVKIEKTVLSKYVAYRGLTLSSCHCIENWFPKIIIVPDCYSTIRNQKIKGLYDEEIPYTDKKDGQEKIWRQKGIKESIIDYEINIFDGAGIHHPSISFEVSEKLNTKSTPTSIMWRLPFIKGLTHEVDYTTFFKEHGIDTITDVWSIEHSVEEEMIIMTESMYKGLKYFKNDGTANDWNDYWDRFHRYNFCFGIAKWNFSLEEEPIYTRANYQVLQDLDLPFDEFMKLAKYSVSWIEKIINGDKFYTYAFLGLTAQKHEAVNNYMEAILLNSEMLKEETVRKYLISLFKKYINDMKCGKIWLKSTFKIFCPDLIMLMEHIGGLPLQGSLEADEFYTKNINGIYKGEYLIERNPHITDSEHVILRATYNNQIARYCSNLSNVCMVNSKSLTPQRLNGADFDGDLVLVIDNNIMKKGVHRDIGIVIDTDDKITALEEQYTKENLLKLTLRTLNSLIGETSNTATCYWNKNPQTEKVKNKYKEYIDILSIVNGKAIDFAKTGVIFNIPRHIARHAKPLPYFMKYASPYYANLDKFGYCKTNMYQLCKNVEQWEKKILQSNKEQKFDYTILINDEIPFDEVKYKQLKKLFTEFNKEMNELLHDNKKFKQLDREWIIEEYSVEFYNMLKNKEYEDDFDSLIYDKYQKKCKKICKNQSELANLLAKICYEDYPHKNKKFIWKMASVGLLNNLKMHKEDVYLPLKDPNGKYEFLGKHYSMVKIDE